MEHSPNCRLAPTSRQAELVGSNEPLLVVGANGRGAGVTTGLMFAAARDAHRAGYRALCVLNADSTPYDTDGVDGVWEFPRGGTVRHVGRGDVPALVAAGERYDFVAVDALQTDETDEVFDAARRLVADGGRFRAAYTLQADGVPTGWLLTLLAPGAGIPLFPMVCTDNRFVDHSEHEQWMASLPLAPPLHPARML